MYIPGIYTDTCILVNSDIEASLAAKLVTSFNFAVKFVCFTVSKKRCDNNIYNGQRQRLLMRTIYRVTNSMFNR